MEISKAYINYQIPLKDVVFNTIRDEILMGRLLPGDRLLEKQLAQKIGVSRTPIREALRNLEMEGLVDMVPRKGAQVASMNSKDIEDLLEVRSTLEVLAVRLCCQHITRSQLERLYTAKDEFEEVMVNSNTALMAEKDEKFHMVILSATNNNKLIQILDSLKKQIYRYSFAYLNNNAYRNIVLKEHSELTEAIASKDNVLAENILKRHIKNQEKALKKNILLKESSD